MVNIQRPVGCAGKVEVTRAGSNRGCEHWRSSRDAGNIVGGQRALIELPPERSKRDGVAGNGIPTREPGFSGKRRPGGRSPRRPGEIMNLLIPNLRERPPQLEASWQCARYRQDTSPPGYRAGLCRQVQRTLSPRALDRKARCLHIRYGQKRRRNGDDRNRRRF